MPTPQQLAYLDHPALRAIKPLMLDPEITEVMINGPAMIYVERGGLMLQTKIRFANDEQLMLVIRALLQNSGREVSTSTPYMDFRLPDGARGNVIIPPLALNGPVVTLRKLTRQLATVEDLVKWGTLSERMGRLLTIAVQARANIVFAGATGTGKTTTLGILARHISDGERIITIEDTAELQLPQAHVIRLECRKANLEGRGEISLADLVRNSLRMRPTRIIVGEIRGDEAIDMIQAITTGHQGCLAVIHASSPEDTISRLEMMLLSRGLLLPLWAVHRLIASAIDLVVQHEMLPDGSRKVTRVTEVSGVDGDHVALKDLFKYSHGTGQDSQWQCSGIIPRIAAKCAHMGLALPPEICAEGFDAR